MMNVHFLWAVTNVAGVFLLLWLLSTNFEFYSRYGKWPAVIAFFVLLSMCSRPMAERRTVKGQYPPEESLTLPDSLSFPTSVVLYDAQVYRITGDWSGLITDERKTTSFTTHESGLLLGVSWQPGYASLKLTPDGRVQYSVPGTLTWYLLSIPLYAQHKILTGEEKLTIR